MADWTPELKAQVIEQYTSKNPTPDTSIEIVKEIAESIDKTANGVMAILAKAGVYVKKSPDTSSKKESGTNSSGTTKLSKQAAIDQLKELITSKKLDVDDDILSRLTGKAAIYFHNLLSNNVDE